jgi:hypothetical protein
MQQEQISPEVQADIDRLIPPPWSRRRRAMVMVGVGAILFVIVYLWTSGWLTTNLALSGSQFGGDGPVAIGFELTNNGARTVEILGVESSPGLELVSVEIADQPLPALDEPALIPPNGTAIVIATYDVVDCAAIDRTDTAFTFDVRFSSGPLPMEHEVQFQTEDFVFDERSPGEVVSWPVAITQYVCP